METLDFGVFCPVLAMLARQVLITWHQQPESTMSLSNMTKTRYLEVRALVRANGLRWAKAHICPLEYADMVEIELSPVDWLEERQRFYTIGADPKSVDFRLTSWTTIV